jgi:hypothetical protein
MGATEDLDKKIKGMKTRRNLIEGAIWCSAVIHGYTNGRDEYNAEEIEKKEILTLYKYEKNEIENKKISKAEKEKQLEELNTKYKKELKKLRIKSYLLTIGKSFGTGLLHGAAIVAIDTAVDKNISKAIAKSKALEKKETPKK